MALKSCKECGQEVSTEAEACPHCGATDPLASKAKAGRGCALGCLELAAVLFVVVILSPGEDEGGTTEAIRNLDASARLTATQLHVINGSGREWTNCTVAINEGLVSGGWRTEDVSIPAGDTVSGGLMSFTSSDGERFNPDTHVVEGVNVRCDQGMWSGEFQ